MPKKTFTPEQIVGKLRQLGSVGGPGETVPLARKVEASGPIPGEFSMLSLSACAIFSPDVRFSCELKPISIKADPKALKVTGNISN